MRSPRDENTKQNAASSIMMHQELTSSPLPNPKSQSYLPRFYLLIDPILCSGSRHTAFPIPLLHFFAFLSLFLHISFAILVLGEILDLRFY